MHLKALVQIASNVLAFRIGRIPGKVPAVECPADAIFHFLFVSKYLRPVGVCVAFGLPSSTMFSLQI